MKLFLGFLFTTEDLLEVVYSYWDGSGHRRTIQIKRGSTIGQFINECRKTLEKDFPELKSVSNDNLLYIKEDLILPHVCLSQRLHGFLL